MISFSYRLANVVVILLTIAGSQVLVYRDKAIFLGVVLLGAAMFNCYYWLLTEIMFDEV